eukprot:CAMPEP_0119483328 /NCGR_PEP_ID=MMETSP1344-20130328/10786_1 /TAXON_ID=236787 /ORGANISM="Florenciella parvula, Strain CCMP2471" /LENGTH=58 /DNA_ID=CAMNT_0007517813 /DNA_START=150 /DNA_END=323 /DNA_ORIENTATION=-
MGYCAAVRGPLEANGASSQCADGGGGEREGETWRKREREGDRGGRRGGEGREEGGGGG